MHPILFQFHGMTIYTYGFFAALAMIAALWIAEKRAARLGLSPSMAADILFVLFISGILGARVMYVWQHWEDFSGNLWAIARIQEGGLVWYGGLFGSVLSGTLYALWRGWPVLKLCDFFAPIAALAHGIGRIGCFFNGCCYGLRTDTAWGVRFPGEPYANLPTQLYEAAGLFLIAGFLFRFSSKPGRDGRVLWMYLVLYAALRFFMEFLRGDNSRYHGLTLPQWMSLGLFAASLVVFMFQRKQK